MPIKSFRGLIAHETIDTISLHTINGSIGYRIVKLQLMPNNPGTQHQESVVKVFSVPQTGTPTNVIDFSDQTLLGAAYFQDNSDKGFIADLQVIFDNTVFNQDIDITYKSTDGTESINYYIELEQVNLSLDENTVATLKDIRNIESVKSRWVNNIT